MSRAGSRRVRHRSAWWRAALAAACTYALLLQAGLSAYTGAAHAAPASAILCASTGDAGSHDPLPEHAGLCCVLAVPGSLPFHGLVPSSAGLDGVASGLRRLAGEAGHATPCPPCARPPVGSRAPPRIC